MKKIITIILLFTVIITITLKIGFFKDIKVFLLTKINTVTHNIYKIKEMNQTKEKLLNIINEYEEKLESYNDLVVKYEMLVKENDELKELMNIKDDTYTIIYAEIVEKSLLYDYVVINKGKKQGIKEGNAVICSTAFIGIVNEVNNNSSVIKLINTMKYPVMNSSTFEVGTINDYKDGYYIIKDFSKEVNIGDLMVTSKYSLDIPSNLLIGTVEDIENDNLGLSKILKVKSNYDYNSINSVGVMVK